MHVDEGLIAEIDDVLNNHLSAVQIGLFTGSPTIDHATVLTDLTEATFAGYGLVTINSLVWPTPTIGGDAAAASVSPLITWTASGGIAGLETITGIFMKIQDPASTWRLWWAELFGTPVDVQFPGDVVQKKLTIKKRNY